MPCYFPLTAYYSDTINPSGRRSLVFRKGSSHSGVGIQIPCSKCIGCKLERSRQWALRCLHEAKRHQESSFLTLTYEDKFLPSGSSLVKRDLQLFMKRLRERRPKGLRFFGCGEYGEMSGRPHYHVLLLNTSFPDMKKIRWGLESSGPNETFASAELAGLWPVGSNVIGQVNFDTCSYVARYCTKIITGEKAALHYGDREPEFAVMSRKPGLGRGWYESFKEEWYKHDCLISDCHPVPIPRYYDSIYLDKLAARSHLLTCRCKDCRIILARRRKDRDEAESSGKRLRVREQVTLRTLRHFKRGQI